MSHSKPELCPYGCNRFVLPAAKASHYVYAHLTTDRTAVRVDDLKEQRRQAGIKERNE